MNVEKLIQKILGKKTFKLSSEVPFSYVFIKGSKYIIGLIRALFKGIGFSEKGKLLYIGKKTRILVKNKITVGDNVRLESGVVIDALSTKGVILGSGVKIGEDSKILCSGSLSNLGYGISIGKNSSFSENTFFGCAGGVTIGEDVIAGQSVRFHSENHVFSDKDKLIREQGVTREGIIVGNNVWIGSGVVFLDGAVVGNNCVIAANTVVKGKYGNGSVLGGVPSKLLKIIE